MNNYTILTDSSCDLPASIIKDNNIKVLPLSILIGEKEYKNYPDEKDIKFKEVYKILREGNMVKTAAVNTEDFTVSIEKLLKEGQDVLYLGFSKALSSTYDNGAIAMDELSSQYPDRKLLYVNTKCASLGEGLLIYLACMQQKEGRTIEEVRDFVEKTKLHLCHWFTVEDLHHLKRGGRVSAATAIIGSMLNIKPIMHVDDEGRLINVDKVRGRQKSIEELFKKAKETSINPQTQTMFISHGDCEDDAKKLANMLKKELKVKDVKINFVGPVIGAHSGPGTLALFFLGEKR